MYIGYVHMHMQITLITHADRQNDNICFPAKPTISTTATNACDTSKKKEKQNFKALMYKCNTF